MKSYRWKAFLPITYKAKPKKADVEWFRQRGVNTEQLALALSVLHHVRRDVVPLVKMLKQHQPDRSENRDMMLVHDHASGAPVKSKNVPHIDMTLKFEREVDARRIIKKPWKFIAPAAENTAIAGVDLQALYLPAILRAEDLIYDQSDWYMKLISNYRSSVSDIALLKQVGQFLHFFANMSQLVIL